MTSITKSDEQIHAPADETQNIYEAIQTNFEIATQCLDDREPQTGIDLLKGAINEYGWELEEREGKPEDNNKGRFNLHSKTITMYPNAMSKQRHVWELCHELNAALLAESVAKLSESNAINTLKQRIPKIVDLDIEVAKKMYGRVGKNDGSRIVENREMYRNRYSTDERAQHAAREFYEQKVII